MDHLNTLWCTGNTAIQFIKHGRTLLLYKSVCLFVCLSFIHAKLSKLFNRKLTVIPRSDMGLLPSRFFSPFHDLQFVLWHYRQFLEVVSFIIVRCLLQWNPNQFNLDNNELVIMIVIITVIYNHYWSVENSFDHLMSHYTIAVPLPLGFVQE